MFRRFGLIILLVGMTTACTPALIMSPSGYESVPVGSSIEDVEKIYGEPFEMRELPGGKIEYHYIQRIDLPGGGIEQKTYVFTVYQGKIAGKEQRYQRDSQFRYVQ